MKTFRAETARTGIDTLSRTGLAWREFGLETLDILRRAVPFEGACFGTIDPSTNLLTASVKSGIKDPCEIEFARHEYVEDRVSLFTDLAVSETGVAILHDETGGDPRRSSRFRELVEPAFGFGHEMRAVMRADGRTWGGFALYREGASSGFSPAEADFVRSISTAFAVGVRSGIVSAAADSLARIAGDDGPVVMVFDEHDEVISATPAAEQRVRDLDGDLWTDLPPSIAAALAAARAVIGGQDRSAPRMTVRTAAGDWLVVHAAPLTGRSGGHHIAVTVERAGSASVLPLVVAAFGLTPRERDVVRGVLTGDTTRSIADTLHLSPYTVQDHLKSIFDKAGVSSRRELVSRIYFDQYAPRVDGELATSGWFADDIETS